MKIRFHFQNAAGSNSPAAKIREATRALCVAYCLRRLGANVGVVSVPPEMESAPHFEFFSELMTHDCNADVTVWPAEFMPKVGKGSRIAWKTSKGVQKDGSYLDLADLVVAMEFDPRLADHKRAFHVPWGVHQRTFDQLYADGILTAFLTNDIQAIRARYCFPETHNRVVFCGSSMNGRAKEAAQISAANPGWFDLHWTPEGAPSIPSADYLRLLGRYQAGLHLHGDTPKTNRFCELAMLGLPVVYLPIAMREDPPVTERNSILLRDLDDGETLPTRWHERDVIRQAADDDYRDGWSYMGQAKRLLERLQ